MSLQCFALVYMQHKVLDNSKWNLPLTRCFKNSSRVLVYNYCLWRWQLKYLFKNQIAYTFPGTSFPLPYPLLFFFVSFFNCFLFLMVLSALSATDVETKCCSLSFSKQWRNVISEASYLYCFDIHSCWFFFYLYTKCKCYFPQKTTPEVIIPSK